MKTFHLQLSYLQISFRVYLILVLLFPSLTQLQPKKPTTMTKRMIEMKMRHCHWSSVLSNHRKVVHQVKLPVVNVQVVA